MLFGFGLGLAVAIGVYLRAPRALMSTGAPPVDAAEQKASATEAQPTPRTTASVKPASEPAPADNRFDFYEILPQFEVVVPQADSRTPPKVRSRPIEEPGSYLLQAGSFKAAADAERLRANLALLGLESQIQQVTIDDNVFNRVRIGPIEDLARVNRTMKQLRDSGIEPQLIRVPE
jgi:cell division protein FtsN